MSLTHVSVLTAAASVVAFQVDMPAVAPIVADVAAPRSASSFQFAAESYSAFWQIKPCAWIV